MYVPFNDLSRIHKPLVKDAFKVFEKIVNNSQFVLNEYIRQFEYDFAKFTGQKYSISCANGTDAIELILRSLNITHGHEVIIPTNSFVATAIAVSRVGATPIFVDNDEYYLMDTKSIKKIITKKTKAIIAVNLYGQMANLKILSKIAKENSIYLIEDAAQSHGAKNKNGKNVGDYSIAAAYSFYPGKNLGAWGDGGAVTTNNKVLAEKIAMLRVYGSKTKYEHKYQGFNSRLQPFQGYVLSKKLEELDNYNEQRSTIANKYNEAFVENKNVITPKTYENNKHVWHLYVLRVKNRNKVIDLAKDAGVETSIHYPIPIHRQKAYKQHSQHKTFFQNADSYSRNLISLPIFPNMTNSEVSKVIKTMTSILN